MFFGSLKGKLDVVAIFLRGPLEVCGCWELNRKIGEHTRVEEIHYVVSDIV